MADINLQKIGQFIKNRRIEKGLSIRDLSNYSGVAAGTISQIETGKTSPNITTLNSICETLQFPVSALFVEDDSAFIKLVRKNDQKSFVRNISNGQNMTESLITKGENEMWGGVIHMPPHTDSGNYFSHEGEEFVFVLKGKVTFDLKDNGTYLLEEQDTLYYPNRIGHRWINETDKEAEMLIVSTSAFRLKR